MERFLNRGKNMKQTRTELILDKAQKMWEDTLHEYDGLPSPHEYEDGYGGHGNRFNYPREYQNLRKICHQNSIMGYAQGVFYALAAASMDKERETRSIRLTDGAGI